MHVKKGDKVKIIAGKERRQPPSTVLRVIPSENRVVVEGRNLVKKHRRGNPALGTESRIEEVEAPIHISNVQLWSEKLGKPVRTQKRWVGQDGKLFESEAAAAGSFPTAPERIRKVRFCAQTEEIFD